MNTRRAHFKHIEPLPACCARLSHHKAESLPAVLAAVCVSCVSALCVLDTCTHGTHDPHTRLFSFLVVHTCEHEYMTCTYVCIHFLVAYMPRHTHTHTDILVLIPSCSYMRTRIHDTCIQRFFVPWFSYTHMNARLGKPLWDLLCP